MDEEDNPQQRQWQGRLAPPQASAVDVSHNRDDGVEESEASEEEEALFRSGRTSSQLNTTAVPWRPLPPTPTMNTNSRQEATRLSLIAIQQVLFNQLQLLQQQQHQQPISRDSHLPQQQHQRSSATLPNRGAADLYHTRRLRREIDAGEDENGVTAESQENVSEDDEGSDEDEEDEDEDDNSSEEMDREAREDLEAQLQRLVSQSRNIQNYNTNSTRTNHNTTNTVNTVGNDQRARSENNSDTDGVVDEGVDLVIDYFSNWTQTSLPFIVLLLFLFVYQHREGILTCFWFMIVLVYCNQTLKKQVSICPSSRSFLTHFRNYNARLH